MENRNYNNLREWYESLPAKDQKGKLDELSVAVGIKAENIKRFWINAGNPPKIGYRLLIEKVTGCTIHYNDTPKTAKVA